jgi:hypothetical protein
LERRLGEPQSRSGGGGEQEVINCVLRSTNFLILFGIRRNCHSSGRNVLLYLFIKRLIKLTAVITNYLQNVILRSTTYVDVIIGDYLDDRSPRVRFQAEGGYFDLHHRVQTGSGAHPTSYPNGTRFCFPGSKVAGA